MEDSTYHYKGWMFLTKRTPESVLKAMENFEVREDDVYLQTYPRSGTTLTQQIVSLIMGHGKIQSVLKVPIKDRSPFLEMHWPDKDEAEFEVLQNSPSPRVIKTHLSVQLAPAEIFEKKPKIVYVIRNPKDVLVSHYHFSLAFAPKKTFSEHLNDFLEGEVLFGSWFDHTKHWLNYKNDDNVLFLRYEDIVQDLKGNIAKIADFLLPDTLNEAKIDEIAGLCTFDSMSKDPKINARSRDVGGSASRSKLIRKGIVGDWKNYLTVAENERFDAEYREKMGDVDISFEAAGLY